MFRSDVQADIFMIICEAARLLNHHAEETV